MQKNSNLRQYTRTGVSAHNTPGGRPRRRWPIYLRRLIVLLIPLIIIAVVIMLITGQVSSSNKPIRINALPTDTMQAFGENLVYYDGMTLHCVGANGNSNWYYALGSGGDFYCSDTSVTAWVSNQVVVLDKDGNATYSDRVDSQIRFARAGEAYVAICYGDDPLSSSVEVLTHTGAPIETITFPDLYLLDVGFFYTRGSLMWVLGLDINGNSAMTNLSTHEPGKMSTGSVDLPDDLAYAIYPQGNNLMVVDTSKIRTYNYKCVEQTDTNSILVYGWQVKQVRSVGRSVNVLLEKMPTSGDQSTFTEVRVLSGYDMRAYRLLSPCFASGITDKGVYGFGSNVIYYAPYGTNTMRANHLGYTITDFVCMLGSGRAVITVGNEVFIIKLPT